MRLAYTADLHGDIGAYRALLELADTAGARAAIVGGDLLPHTPRLAEAVARQRAFVERELGPLLAGHRERSPGLEVYLLPGNDDWAAAVGALAPLEAAGLARPLHERVYPLEPEAEGGGLWLAGFACVPLTPFSIKDYERRDGAWPAAPYSFGMAYTSDGGAPERADAAAVLARPSIQEALEALARRSDPARTVYVCHAPPAGTPLDAAPRGRHLGSRAVREFVERHAPPLTLHGHVHEAPEQSGSYAARLGRTWCVNPGHDRSRFFAVTLDTADIGGTLEHTVFGRPS